jgi:molybdate/tungstate transport system substrate-binding protein
MNMQKPINLLLILGILLPFFIACSEKKDTGKQEKGQKTLIVSVPGSLQKPVEEIAREFSRVFPDIQVTFETGGSIENIRKITEKKSSPDVVISFDYNQMSKHLIPEYTLWSIPFAANEMVIAYHGKSKDAGIIDTLNWIDILLKPDVVFGRADKNSDPSGAKTIMTLKLAENYYKKSGLAEKFQKKGNTVVVEKAQELMGLLDSGRIDYFLVYRSMAMQNNLKYILLPDEINLKNPRFFEKYAQATIEVQGRNKGKTRMTAGDPIIYGVTILKTSQQPEIAIRFISMMLDKDKGLALFEKYGHTPIVPSFTTSFSQVPEKLKPYALQNQGSQLMLNRTNPN